MQIIIINYSVKVNNNAVLLETNREREKENIRVLPSSYGYDRMITPSSMQESLPPAHHYATPTIYKERDLMSEMEILYEFLTRGIDHEDIEYLRRSYEALLGDDTQSYWLNDTHWVDHPATDVPSPAKRRKRDEVRLHVTGCARTEGYYKVDLREKLKHKVRLFILSLSLSSLYIILNIEIFQGNANGSGIICIVLLHIYR
jgi:hypothetical protein